MDFNSNCQKNDRVWFGIENIQLRKALFSGYRFEIDAKRSGMQGTKLLVKKLENI